MTRLRRIPPLLLSLILLIAGVSAYEACLPVLQGSDEAVHFNYVAQLLIGGGLPDRGTYQTNATRQASGQPPFAYVVTALLGRFLGIDPINGDQVLIWLDGIRNPWYQPHDTWARSDNTNMFVLGDDDQRSVREVAFAWSELATQDRLLRMQGMFWALIAALGAYFAAREVFAGRSWALTAALLFALMPTMLYLSSYVTNDTAATAFSAWTTWGAMRIVRRGAGPGLLLLTGTALALGALSKVSVLLIAPAVGVAVIAAPGLSSCGASWKWALAIIWRSLIVAAPLVIVFGPWLAYGWLNYGDPFGFGTHHHNVAFAYSQNLLPLNDVLKQFPHTYLSYLGWFDTVPLHPMTYTALGAAVGLALTGLALALRHVQIWSPTHSRQALVLAVLCAVVLLGMVRWMQQLSFTGGRLMYPAHSAVALVLTAGLYALWRRWPRVGRGAQAYTVVVVAVSGIVIGPLAIRSAFAAPPRLDEASLPALTGGMVEFAEPGGDAPFLRLLGAAYPAGDRITGDTFPLSLCWEALGQPSREPAFSAKLMLNGEIAADRTSLFGMGRYPSILWQPGDIWCDTFDLWMDDPDLVEEPPLRPGERYDLLVTVLDADTKASDFVRTRDGVPIDAVMLGQAVSPAGQMEAEHLTPTTIEFPGLAHITGIRTDGGRSDSPLTLTLAYDVEAETPVSWATFVHLYRNGEFYGVLADGIPRGGRYPTTDWRPGEQVVDSWTLDIPAFLEAGDYDIRVGLYDPTSGERHPVIVDGIPAANDSAVLPVLRIVAEY